MPEGLMTRTLAGSILVLAIGCGENQRTVPRSPTGPGSPVPPSSATWTVRGTVTDSLIGLSGAQVEIIGGVGTGRSTTTATGPAGFYQLAGLTGDVELRVSKPGFESQVRMVRGSSDRPGVDFGLVPMNPANLAGAWRLTIQASLSCDTLLESVRTRTYQVVVHQSGARATVAFVDEAVLLSTIEAVVQEKAVRVLIGTLGHDSNDGFRERLSPETVLSVTGWVPEATLSPSRISGVLQASIVTYEVPTNASLEELLRLGRVTGSCLDDHRFTLER